MLCSYYLLYFCLIKSYPAVIVRNSCFSCCGSGGRLSSHASRPHDQATLPTLTSEGNRRESSFLENQPQHGGTLPFRPVYLHKHTPWLPLRLPTTHPSASPQPRRDHFDSPDTPIATVDRIQARFHCLTRGVLIAPASLLEEESALRSDSEAWSGRNPRYDWHFPCKIPNFMSNNGPQQSKW